MSKNEPVNQAEEQVEEVADQQVETPAAVPEVELQVLSGDQKAGSSVQTARFAPVPNLQPSSEQGSIDLLFDVQLHLSVELGRTSIPVREILQLGPGSIVELDKLAGEPVDILVNGKLIARGEVVVVDENFGVRVTEIASQTEVLSQAA